MRRAVLVVALLILLAGAPVAGAQQTPAVSPDRTTFVVQLQADGDARWRVTTTYLLDSANETRAFRRYGAAFEAGEPVHGPDATFFRTAVEQVSEATGREMEIRNVTRNYTVQNDTGRLVLELTWTNFLEHGENGTLVLNDALKTPDNGTWLKSIGPSQTLRVRTPPGYSIASTGDFQVTLRPNSFVVEGPESFAGNGPLTVTYNKAQQTPTPPAPPRTPWELITGAAVVVAVALVVVTTFLWRRRGTSAEPESPEAGGPPPEPERREAAGGEAATEAAEAAGEAEEEENLELLSDEERVERLLEREGGRMRQADIVKETDWSDAKVSQLLSRMADEGRIEKLRIGRENLISLPDYESDEE